MMRWWRARLATELFVGTGNEGEEETLWVRLPMAADAGAMPLRLDPLSIAEDLARSSGE